MNGSGMAAGMAERLMLSGGVGWPADDAPPPSSEPVSSASSTVSPDAQHVSPGRDEYLATIEICVLFAIFLMALVGNSSILLALQGIRAERRMSRVHYFMLHLSVADILVAFFNVLPQLAWDITYRFVGPNLLCKLVKYSQVLTLYLSTFILVAMAIDRYHVIYGRTTFHSNSIICARYMVRLAWLFAALCALPQLFIFSVQQLPSGERDCWGTFRFSWGERAYIIWFSSVVFLVPLMIIAFCYSAMTYRIYQCSRQGQAAPASSFEPVGSQVCWESQPETLCCLQLELRVRSRPGTAAEHRVQVCDERRRISAAKVQSVKLTLCVVLCFVVCWAPFCCTQFYLTFFPPQDTSKLPAVFVILLLLASLNSCTNPWIYLCFSKDVTVQLKTALHCKGGTCELLSSLLSLLRYDQSLVSSNIESEPPRGCAVIAQPVTPVIQV
ncbi:oxytocin receptor-like [Amphibalanus amphitrite]|uniref:oxytocin receptor-like n=1 Tax=Amphibalanus amphitrite TaxID=1232801 RepID=UPI001C92B470|nr:oxytocin receptor-like [Amphibalanus amphitrite]